MKIADVMTRKVELTSPDESLQQAASRMAQEDIGVLPVGENDRLIGMITDRDIAVRAVAKGMSPSQTKVREAMTEQLLYCYEDDEIEKANEAMERMEIRRMPIVNRDKRLVGIVSIGDLAAAQSAGRSGETLKSVARPH